MSKTRVFCSINGDYEMTPVIVIVREGISMADFLAKAAKKLKVPEEKKLTRCFYSSGEVIDDPFDMMPEDKLFLSFGEDFKAKGSGGILSGGLSAIAGGASSLYDKVSGFAKSKMSEEMKKKFEATEAAVSSKLTPALEKAKELSAPAIGRADAMLDKASDKFTEKKKEFMATTRASSSRKGDRGPRKVRPPRRQRRFRRIGIQAERAEEKMLPLKAVDGVRAKMGKGGTKSTPRRSKRCTRRQKTRKSHAGEAQGKPEETRGNVDGQGCARAQREAPTGQGGRLWPRGGWRRQKCRRCKGDAIGAAEDAASEPAANDAEPRASTRTPLWQRISPRSKGRGAQRDLAGTEPLCARERACKCIRCRAFLRVNYIAAFMISARERKSHRAHPALHTIPRRRGRPWPQASSGTSAAAAAAAWPRTSPWRRPRAFLSITDLRSSSYESTARVPASAKGHARRHMGELLTSVPAR